VIKTARVDPGRREPHPVVERGCGLGAEDGPGSGWGAAQCPPYRRLADVELDGDGSHRLCGTAHLLDVVESIRKCRLRTAASHASR